MPINNCTPIHRISYVNKLDVALETNPRVIVTYNALRIIFHLFSALKVMKRNTFI